MPVIRTIEDGGLRGRGGAGFPKATKWRSVPCELVGTAADAFCCTMVGDVRHHGVVEFAMCTPLREVIETIGLGPVDRRRVVAVLPVRQAKWCPGVVRHATHA